jgi:RNA polymerase sigma-70 factor, ECF subfamily
MQETAAYIGANEALEFLDGKRGVQELLTTVSGRLPSFYRSAYRLLGNSADAEDAVQDALLAAYKHLDQFRGQAQMSTWLTSIVCNCARMKLRSRPRHVHVSLDEPIGEDRELSLSDQLADSGFSPEDQCRGSELNRHLRTLMPQLSPTLRKTFQLRELEGLSIRETAAILGVPPGTVKAQLARARKKLGQLTRRAFRLRSRPTGRSQSLMAV